MQTLKQFPEGSDLARSCATWSTRWPRRRRSLRRPGLRAVGGTDGVHPDSRSGERVFRAARRQARLLRQLVGEERYRSCYGRRSGSRVAFN